MINSSKLKKAKLFIGLPGSGKTTYIENNIIGYHIVDADQIKTTHPEWNQECPETIHEWSVKEAEKEMNRVSDQGIDICMDSGGVNNRYSIRIITMLKSKGYWVELIHMDTPLEVCLRRNSQRKRKVPEYAILDKSNRINDCLEKQKLIVDSYIRVAYHEASGDYFMKAFDTMRDIISWIREIRSKYNIPIKSKKLDLYIDLMSIDITADHAVLASSGLEGIMMKWNMGNLSKIEYSPISLFKSKTFFESACINGINVYIPIDTINKADRIAEINKEVIRIRNQIKSSELKVSNSNFVERAPKEIIDQEFKRLSDFKNLLRLNQSIILQLEAGEEEYDLVLKFGDREKMMWHVQYLRERKFSGDPYSDEWFIEIYKDDISSDEVLELYMNGYSV